jgi:hypothetical protein
MLKRTGKIWTIDFKNRSSLDMDASIRMLRKNPSTFRPLNVLRLRISSINELLLFVC